MCFFLVLGDGELYPVLLADTLLCDLCWTLLLPSHLGSNNGSTIPSPYLQPSTFLLHRGYGSRPYIRYLRSIAEHQRQRYPWRSRCRQQARDHQVDEDKEDELRRGTDTVLDQQDGKERYWPRRSAVGSSGCLLLVIDIRIRLAPFNHRSSVTFPK